MVCGHWLIAGTENNKRSKSSWLVAGVEDTRASMIIRGGLIAETSAV